MQKRISWTTRWRVAVATALGVLGLGVCGLFVVVPVGKTLCFIRPDSLHNPPVPANAENIEVGRAMLKPDKGYEAKLITFQTKDNPDEVYQFYKQSLVAEGWMEESVVVLTTYPYRANSKFTWDCGIDSPNLFATIWLHSEVNDSRKTEVMLNYEYLPR